MPSVGAARLLGSSHRAPTHSRWGPHLMLPHIGPLLYCVLLFVGMLAMLEAGRFVALRGGGGAPDDSRGRFDTVEAAVFALFGLLIAFTFSGAANRFLEKQMLVAEEANDIGTAYLRVDLVAPPAQPALRELFRQYLDARIAAYERLPDVSAAMSEMAKSKELQNRIWAGAIQATRSPDAASNAALLLLPALNTMFDITTTRTMALQMHPPKVIFALLFALGLLCSLLAGHRMALRGRRNWLHILGFAVFTAAVVYVILDVEYPRIGLIRISGADRVLVELRRSMK